jgi:hypothetical protein
VTWDATGNREPKPIQLAPNSLPSITRVFQGPGTPLFNSTFNFLPHAAAESHWARSFPCPQTHRRGQWKFLQAPSLRHVSPLATARRALPLPRRGARRFRALAVSPNKTTPHRCRRRRARVQDSEACEQQRIQSRLTERLFYRLLQCVYSRRPGSFRGRVPACGCWRPSATNASQCERQLPCRRLLLNSLRVRRVELRER